MCLAVPGRLVELYENKGIVEVGSIRREVFMNLLPDARIGEYVLVHAGCAIEIIDEDEAKKTLDIMKELLDDEIR